MSTTINTFYVEPATGEPLGLRWIGLPQVEADGLACVACGRHYLTAPVRRVPVGRADATDSQVFACADVCADVVAQEARNAA
ncbi:hypothetical protein [Amycolatopsis magusensis]|uniref:hypothetical protein n=1 Tax=Amycolatopsis magusensis TaxID=882444 RepID=UPI0037B4CEB2